MRPIWDNNLFLCDASNRGVSPSEETVRVSVEKSLLYHSDKTSGNTFQIQYHPKVNLKGKEIII